MHQYQSYSQMTAAPAPAPAPAPTPAPTPKPTMGIVLAGGRSSRMGKDKALLQLTSQSMLSKTEQLLHNANIERVMISRNDGEYGHVQDIIPHKGPLSGIHSVATRFPQYNFLVMPVDLPLMDASTLQQLIECGERLQKNVRFAQHSLPVFINNTPLFRQVIDFTLRCTDQYSVQGLLSHFPILDLTCSTDTTLFNTNTPEQWCYAMQHVASAQTTHLMET